MNMLIAKKHTNASLFYRNQSDCVFLEVLNGKKRKYVKSENPVWGEFESFFTDWVL